MRTVSNWLATASVAGLTGYLWLSTGTPLSAVSAYLVTFAWGVLVPGWLLYRIVQPKRDSLFTDLVVGTTVGLAVSLFVWLALTAFGANWLFLAWPAVPLLATIHPQLRRVWTGGRYPSGLSAVSGWLFAAVCAVAVGNIASGLFATSALPPDYNQWYQDDYWHMALSAQLMHSVPPDLPQVAGTPFWYHWFANAHIAAMSAASGVDLAVVVARLWMPAVVLAGLGMLVVIGKELTDAYWPGVVSASLAATAAAVYPSAWFGLYGLSAFGIHSPSQQFAICVSALAIWLLLILVRDGRLTKGQWFLLVVGLLASSGAKGSTLPVIVCAMLAVTAMALIVGRDRLRAAALGMAATTVIFLVTMPLTSGGSAGIQLQLFSTVRALRPWGIMLGGSSPPVSLEPVLPGLDHTGAPVLLMLVLASYVVALGYVWISAPLWRARQLPCWLLLGIGAAGASAMMLVNQDGLSQVYFLSGAIIALHSLAGWGAFWAWQRFQERGGREQSIGIALIGVSCGGLGIMVITAIAGGTPAPSGLNSSIATALGLWVGTSAVVGVVIAVLRGHRRALWLGFVAAQFGAAVPLTSVLIRSKGAALAAYIAVAIVGVGFIAARRVGGRLTVVIAGIMVVLTGLSGLHAVTATEQAARYRPNKKRTVTGPETTAALWLRDNSAPTDVVATNMHCADKNTIPNCDARSFWIGAFTERRVLIEGWGYTVQAHQAHGVGGRRFANQPFHDPKLFALNEQAFTDPNAQVIDDLTKRGVTWLFADRFAGPISPKLVNYADLTHRTADVQIYRLR